MTTPTDPRAGLDRYIWIAPGTWAPLAVIAADIDARGKALEAARKYRAHRRYRALVLAFAEHDKAAGATPLVAPALANGPAPKIRKWRPHIVRGGR